MNTKNKKVWLIVGIVVGVLLYAFHSTRAIITHHADTASSSKVAILQLNLPKKLAQALQKLPRKLTQQLLL